MSNLVKAAVMIEPGKIEIKTFPMPDPEPKAILIERELCGICGTDKHTYSGYTVQYKGTDHERSLQFPIIPGHEIVGRIAAIGKCHEPLTDFSGKPLEIGDRVVLGPDLNCGKCYYCRNGFDYYFCTDLQDYGNSLSAANPPHLFGGFADIIYALPGSYIFKVPEGLPSKIAVLTELMAVTTGLDKAKQFSAVHTEGFRFNDTVLIQGAGPLGICHIIKARMLGAGKIIVIDPNPSAFRLNLAKEMGADVIINYNKLDRKRCLETIRELTDGRGADIVVECAGLPEAISEGLDYLRSGGFYIETGNFVDMGEISIKSSIICTKNLRIIGIGGEAATVYGPTMDALERYMKDYPLDKIVSHLFRVEEAEKAIQFSMNGDCMKVAIASNKYFQ
jgi:L-iditol 2-dehydrogenase